MCAEGTRREPEGTPEKVLKPLILLGKRQIINGFNSRQVH
nr:MAG TPA: hypothetical protein [Bacteriophage sp.]